MIFILYNLSKTQMDYSKKSIKELHVLCKENNVKNYQKKNKDEIIQCLIGANKKNKGQFYTTQCTYVLDSLPRPPDDVRCIIEPFAGRGDLIDWVQKYNSFQIKAYDIEPKRSDIEQKDTLIDPPDYNDSWIITNPPYLARNKCDDKNIYELYNTNDLYKCFITSVVRQNNCRGGIFIVPAGFFFSPRDIDVRCRNDFMTNFRITKVKYFEETVFEDTPTTIVAFSFEKAVITLGEQDVEWLMLPSKTTRTFHMSSRYKWIVGGEIYYLTIPSNISVRRHVEGQELAENEQQTFMTLRALDSGTKNGKISLTYKRGYIYPAKESSRTFATLRVCGVHLSEAEQVRLCYAFNDFLNKKRQITWSLFLPQYRESKEYARKRIPFGLAYRIFLHVLQQEMFPKTNQSIP